MIIQLDNSYKISFKGKGAAVNGVDFTVLDGFYEVLRAYGWGELYASGIDLNESLMKPAGITDTSVLLNLQESWINDTFYFCVGMDTDRQIWVPSSIISGYPDPRIASYKKLALAIKLGVFASANDFELLGKDIMNYLRAHYCIDQPDGIISIYGNQWMTTEDYNSLDTKRKCYQGLAFTSEKATIPASASATNFITTTVNFTKPKVVSNDVEDTVLGAIADTISVIIGSSMNALPQGTVSSTSACWYFIPTCYAWKNGNVVAYSKSSRVAVGTKLFSTSDLTTVKGTITGVIPAVDSTPASVSVTESSDNTVATYTRDASLDVAGDVLEDSTELEQKLNVTFDGNILKSIRVKTAFLEATQLNITYRFRNKRPGMTSAYTEVINYAYENIALKQRITELEEVVRNLDTTIRNLNEANNE